jgi:urease accessory protein
MGAAERPTMFDTSDRTATSPGTSRPALQRARGAAMAALSLRRGRTRLDGLRQQGCAKAFLPREPGEPEIVFLNTSGGLTGGDRLSYALTLGEGARATATTQTAERAYAAPGGDAPARLDVRLETGPGARLDWLPQETILYDGAALERQTAIVLGRGAELLMCETLVLGRAAMGESVRRLRLFDRRSVTRDGRPVLVDAVELTDGSLASAAGEAGLAGARAVALVALVAPGAEDAAGPLRALPLPGGVRAAVSGWDGKCVMRLMAGDSWPLRLALAAALRHLRARRGDPPALPRVWQI